MPQTTTTCTSRQLDTDRRAHAPTRRIHRPPVGIPGGRYRRRRKSSTKNEQTRLRSGTPRSPPGYRIFNQKYTRGETITGQEGGQRPGRTRYQGKQVSHTVKGSRRGSIPRVRPARSLRYWDELSISTGPNTASDILRGEATLSGQALVRYYSRTTRRQLKTNQSAGRRPLTHESPVPARLLVEDARLGALPCTPSSFIQNGV